MSENIEISLGAGKSFLLETAGKICDKNIVIKNKTAQDTFWDIYQQNGERTNYGMAFAGVGWTDENFKPKYNITATETSGLFQNNYITDLVKILEDCGVELDLSKATEGVYLVNGCNNLTRLPVLDCRNRANINYFIISCPSLYSIEKVILKDDGTQAFNNYSFSWLYNLEEIRFEGCIGNSLAIKESSKLSAASVQSIIDCLKDLTGQTQQTLTLHATVGANMTDAQKAAITAKNWQLVY